MLGSAPEEVSLQDAVADARQAQDQQTQDEAGAAVSISADQADHTSADQTSADQAGQLTDSDDDGPTAVDDLDNLDGVWSVDAQTGSFTLEDASGSFAGFRVREELAGIGAFTAVGRTGDVGGSMEIVDETVTPVEVEVDLTTLRTDDTRRDGAVQRALGTSRHPTATFTLTEALDIDGAAGGGALITLSAPGDLTVNGITQPVAADIEAQLVGEVIAVVGSVEVRFADFDVTVPQVPIVLSAEDHGIMEFQLLFVRR